MIIELSIVIDIIKWVINRIIIYCHKMAIVKYLISSATLSGRLKLIFKCKVLCCVRCRVEKNVSEYRTSTLHSDIYIYLDSDYVSFVYVKEYRKGKVMILKLLKTTLMLQMCLLYISRSSVSKVYPNLHSNI